MKHDVALVVGLASFVVGCFFIYRPASLLALGAALIFYAVKTAQPDKR